MALRSINSITIADWQPFLRFWMNLRLAL